MVREEAEKGRRQIVNAFGFNIIIATTGSLKKALRRNPEPSIYLDKIDYFILDEVDRIFERNSGPNISFIYQSIVKQR